MSQFSNLKYTDPFHIHGSTVISMVICNKKQPYIPSRKAVYVVEHVEKRSKHVEKKEKHSKPKKKKIVST